MEQYGNRIVNFILSQPIEEEITDNETYDMVFSSIMNCIENSIPSIKIDRSKVFFENMFKVYKHKNTLGIDMELYSVMYNDEIFFFVLNYMAFILNKEIYKFICKKIFAEYAEVVVNTEKFKFDSPELNDYITFRDGRRSIRLDNTMKMRKSKALKESNDITDLFSCYRYNNRDFVSFIPEILNEFTTVTNYFWYLFNIKKYVNDNKIKIVYYHDLHDPMRGETEEESGIVYFDNKEVFAFYFYGVYYNKPDNSNYSRKSLPIPYHILHKNIKTLRYVKFAERRIIDADAYIELCNYMYELRNSDNFIKSLNVNYTINERHLVMSLIYDDFKTPFKFDGKEYNSFNTLKEEFGIDYTKLILEMKTKIKNNLFTNTNDFILDYILSHSFEFRGLHYKSIQECCEQLGIGDLYHYVEEMNNDEASVEYVLSNQDILREPNPKEPTTLFKNIMGNRETVYNENPNTFISCYDIYESLDKVGPPTIMRYRPRNLSERKDVANKIVEYCDILIKETEGEKNDSI